MKLDNLPVYSVTGVNEYARQLLEHDGLLSGVLVRGEVSNYKRYPSGHHYFSLKDDSCTLKCVMFKGSAFRLRFQPADGMQVVAFGQVSVYPPSGQFQLNCKDMMQDGRGALDEAFERLRRRLEAEGLFDQANKKPLPRYPKRVALITSPVGKVVGDMLTSLRDRWPMTQALVVPVRVQGPGAAEEIAAAIHRVNNRADIDVIITGRGGGSKEELWAFNEEPVARAIYLSDIPVVSAVGHEPDITIADYVADLRAITPTKAGVEVVPNQREERYRLEQLGQRLAMVMEGRLTAARRELARLQKSRVLTDITAPIQDRRQTLDGLRRRMRLALGRETGRSRHVLSACKARLPLAVKARLSAGRGQLGCLAAGLDAMSPLKVLGRGYAIARKGEDVVSSIAQAEAGDRLDVLVSDGTLRCEVKTKKPQAGQ